MTNRDNVITICNGKKEFWENRQDAMKEFIVAIYGTEGSEQQRYINIYTKLKAGCRICTDRE